MERERRAAGLNRRNSGQILVVSEWLPLVVVARKQTVCHFPLWSILNHRTLVHNGLKAMAHASPPPSGKAHVMWGFQLIEPTVRAARIRRDCSKGSQWKVLVMKLSAPIYHLKRRAKAEARRKVIPLNKALDRIAREEGFCNWSLLSATTAVLPASSRLLARLAPGDLVLLGGRPGHGKTMLGLKLIVDAIKNGHRGMFFTLEYDEQEVLSRFRTVGGDPALPGDLFDFDNSDAISADYIMARLRDAPSGTVVVVDYLQLLDQRRRNPQLMLQVRALKSFARDTGQIIVLLSQIDRSYNASIKPCPDLSDVRLPNPLDLGLFDKSCFLNNGRVRIQPSA